MNTYDYQKWLHLYRTAEVQCGRPPTRAEEATWAAGFIPATFQMDGDPYAD